MCFCFNFAEGGGMCSYISSRSDAATIVLSCSETVGMVQCVGSSRYVPVILYPFVVGT